MKTKEIDGMVRDWHDEWVIDQYGGSFFEFVAKKIKQHFQRRKPKCVWIVSEAYDYAWSKCGKGPDKKLFQGLLYCPYCGGKIEVTE